MVDRTTRDNGGRCGSAPVSGRQSNVRQCRYLSCNATTRPLLSISGPWLTPQSSNRCPAAGAPSNRDAISGQQSDAFLVGNLCTTRARLELAAKCPELARDVAPWQAWLRPNAPSSPNPLHANGVGDDERVGVVGEDYVQLAARDGVNAVAQIVPERPAVAEVVGCQLLVDRDK